LEECYILDTVAEDSIVSTVGGPKRGYVDRWSSCIQRTRIVKEEKENVYVAFWGMRLCGPHLSVEGLFLLSSLALTQKKADHGQALDPSIIAGDLQASTACTFHMTSLQITSLVSSALGKGGSGTKRVWIANVVLQKYS
jgi:hypothetical protein